VYMISLHIRVVVPQTDQTRRAARPRPRIPPSRCGACPCRMQMTQRRMWKCSALQAGKLAWARGDPSHARRGERGPETEAGGNETCNTETRDKEAEHNTEAPKRACATSTPDPSETTDDGYTSPILRVSGHREQRVPQPRQGPPPSAPCRPRGTPHTPSRPWQRTGPATCLTPNTGATTPQLSRLPTSCGSWTCRGSEPSATTR